MEYLHSIQSLVEQTSKSLVHSEYQDTQKILSKQKSNNDDHYSQIVVEVDRKRKCPTCKSLMFVGFENCTECDHTTGHNKS